MEGGKGRRAGVPQGQRNLQGGVSTITHGPTLTQMRLLALLELEGIAEIQHHVRKPPQIQALLKRRHENGSSEQNRKTIDDEQTQTPKPAERWCGPQPNATAAQAKSPLC